jgi:N-methylhydantoinase A/oxoprolinase/acetone carboxylase beta subunit
MMIKVGIDIGGTFTDAMAMDEATGEIWSAKVPTTYPDPSESFVGGLGKLLSRKDLTPAQADLVIHGTTLVTNAIIERKGGPIGLITTRGFGDVLWNRTERRYDLFDVMIEFPNPLVERRHVIEIPERIRYNGEVVQPLDEEAVKSAIDVLGNAGIEAVAVCLLHSYAEPEHEQRIASLIRDRCPDVQISLSSEVWPEANEYHRMSTAVANAYVQPVTEHYLDRLVESMTENGFQGKFYLMLSSGGIAAVETGKKLPVQLIASGPAAGVLAAGYLAEVADLEDILSFDMGGTTAKLSLIEGREPVRSNLVEAARLKRHMPGSGIPIRVPVVGLLEIGSGGGSIARIDHLGLLKVGPESAGADPGPACYGWGGRNPTVTDADLVLGYLSPSYFLGGEMSLDLQAARNAIDEGVAGPGNLSIVAAAAGIHNVVNQDMALAAKMHVLERGRDPSGYALVAYGGAGPVHAYGVARILGTTRVIVPPSAGVAASLGFMVAPIAFDLTRSLRMSLPGCDWQVLRTTIENLETKGANVLFEADVKPEEVRFARTADMRYVGQGYEVTVPMPSGCLDPSKLDSIVEAFQEVYRQKYEHLPPGEDTIEFVRLGVRAWAPITPPELPRVSDQRAGTIEPLSYRQAYFREVEGFLETPVYRWNLLSPGIVVSGPSIVEAVDTTVVVGPQGRMTMSEKGYLEIDIEGGMV